MPRKHRDKAWVERSGGYWRCRWYMAGKPGQSTFTMKADADELCRITRRNMDRALAGLPPIKTASGVSVSEWGRRWLEKRSKNPRKNTYVNFDIPATNQFVAWCVGQYGDAPLATIGSAEI